MRKYSCLFAAALLAAACSDSAENPSAPAKPVSTAYLAMSPANPAPGTIATVSIRPGAGDATLGSFAARVLLPAGVSFAAERAVEGAHAVRVAGDTVIIAAAQPTGFADALYAFDVRVDAPEALSSARLEMTEATPVDMPAAAAGDTTIAAGPVSPTWGDITFDGLITAADAQAALSASLSLNVLATYQIPLADANCDGNVAAADAQIILASAVGSSVSQFCIGTAAVVVLSGEVRNVVLFTPVGGAKVTLTTTGADAAVALPRQASTGATGAYVLYNNVPDGTYSMTISGVGYQNATAAAVVVSKANPHKVDATLTPTTFTSNTYASVSGRVVLGNGTPVAGAAVQLSGGIPTNGPFRATTTGADGSYSFTGITLTDENGTPIPAFSVIARSLAGEVGSTAGLTFTANEVETAVNVTVAPSATVTNTFFEEGFESGIPGTWTATGLWSPRGTDVIRNKAYPTNVKLAPTDASGGAVPLPKTGVGAAWAGSPLTGNFIGVQRPTDTGLSGGMSEDPTEGLLTSPDISIPAGAAHATLYFDAWFEIESVNPNASGFDIMEVTVTDVVAGKTKQLTRLNPFEDPPATSRQAMPFTSGGFNRNPVWRPVYFNLDAYKGKTVRLGFCFRSVDQLYNGFRGWLIDNVRLSDEIGFSTAEAGAPMGARGSAVGRPNRGTTSEKEAAFFVSSCASDVEETPVGSVTVTPGSASLKITETLQLFATPFDSSGVGLAGRSISWFSNDFSIASVTQSGLVTAKANGTTTITAFVDGASAQMSVTVGPPTSTMAINAGNNQTAVVGQPVSIPPSVKIVSASGAPVPGATVTFTVTSGGGTISGLTTQTTNANGIAAITGWFLGATSGNNTLTVSSPAVTNGPLIFTARGAPAGLNLTIENIYISQATQTMANDVPLVAGRPALMRIFLKAGAPNNVKPTVRVRFFKGATLVSTHDVTSTLTSVPTAITENNLASSWNLLLTATDLEPGMSVLADVDPTDAIVESSETDNTYPKSGTPLSLDVRTVPPLNVTFIPVTQPGGVTANVSDANKDAFLDFAKRIYPIATYDAVVHAPFTYNKTLSSGYDATWTDLLLQIKTLRIAELPAPGRSRYYYGVIHPTYVSGATGLAYLGDPAAVGVDVTTNIVGNTTDSRSMTVAHELGHNFNRKHVDCGGPANIDPLFPYVTTSIGAYGYDVFKDKFIPLAGNVDVMSYCNLPWISDYTYKAVLEYRNTVGPIASFEANAPSRGLLVWGQIGPNGIELQPSFEVNALPSLPEMGGANSIQALDEKGSAIFSLSFAGDPVDHLPGVRQFAYVVPLPRNAAAPAALRLRANGREVIHRATAAAQSAPSVSRVGGRSRLQWNAQEHPMAMIRDAATGQILSFARGGTAEFLTQRSDVEVVLSNGVTSVRRTLRVPPQ